MPKDKKLSTENNIMIVDYIQQGRSQCAIAEDLRK